MICLRVRSIHDFSIFLQLFLQKAYKRLSNNKIWGVTSTLPFIYISNVQLSSIICLCILSIFICSKSIFFKITELWQFLPLKNLNLLPRDIFQDISIPHPEFQVITILYFCCWLSLKKRIFAFQKPDLLLIQNPGSLFIAFP